MIEQRPDLRSFPKHVVAPRRHDRIEPPLTVGGYVNTPLGWSKVENISRDVVIVSVFAFREDPGPQNAPDIDAEIKWRESGADREPRFERYEVSLVRSRSFIASEGA